MTHDANRCLCEECLDYRAAQVRRNRRRGLRDLSTFTPVVVTRDAATGATSSEPGYDGLGHTSSTVGEGAPTPREARATVLDALPRPVAEVSGPAGPESTLLVHQRGRRAPAGGGVMTLVWISLGVAAVFVVIALLASAGGPR